MKRIFWIIVSFLLVSILFFSVNFILSGNSAGELFNIFLKISNSFFFIIILSVIFLILKENKSPTTTLAWIQIMIFLPFVGFILYLIFGINYRKRKIFSIKQKEDLIELEKLYRFSSIDYSESKNYAHSEFLRIIKLAENNANSELNLNNEITVFFNGKDTIDALLESLEKATHYIHLEYFSISNDEIGNRLKNILIKKSLEGVKIKLIYDAVGSWRLGKSYINELERNSIEVKAFLPVKIPILSSKLNYRNHRKIVIIDGKIGFIGGVNIGDKYYGKSKYYGYWRDSHLKIEGDAVHSIQRAFLINWLFLDGKTDHLANYFPSHNITNKVPVQIISSGADSNWENIMQAYFSSINIAKQYIYIQTPYLVPNESMLTALKTASLSGVDVRIIVPSFPDHKIVFYGSRSYFDELLEAKIKIYEYQKGFIHSKTLIVDDKFVSIGSANMDIRSFEENFEINSLIYDETFAKKIHHQFELDFLDSKKISIEEISKKNIFVKSSESISRLVSPLL